MIKIGDYVKVKRKNIYGKVVDILDENRFLVESSEDEYDSFAESQLVYQPPIYLSKQDLMNIFRGNVNYFDLLGDVNLDGNFICETKYYPDLDDLIALLMNFKLKDSVVGDFVSWAYAVNFSLQEYIDDNPVYSEDPIDGILLKTQGDAYSRVFRNELDFTNNDFYEKINSIVDLDNIIQGVLTCKNNLGLSEEQRQYDNTTKSIYISYIMETDCLDELSDSRKQLYKKFAMDLAEKGYRSGLEICGYGYYGGNSVFETDWIKARDIFEELYSKYADPAYANTLGYIYYYGRCNNGVGEFDKAFKYYTIGYIAGNEESSYKLADMFTYGQYVSKNLEMASEIVSKLFGDCLKEFCQGGYQCKLADVALRLGNIYIDSLRDYYGAYYMYLIADYAIKKRMELGDYFGDDKVYTKIKEAISICKEKLDIKVQKSISIIPSNTLNMLWEDDYLVRATSKEKGYYDVAITFERIPKDGLNSENLFSFVDFDGAYLSDKIEIIAKNSMYDGEIDMCDGGFMVGDELHLTYKGELVGVIAADEFILNNPLTKKKSKKQHRIAAVKFNDTNKLYDYLCDDESIGEGDIVKIDGKDALVVEIKLQKESELKLPLSKYKTITK